MSDVQSAGPGLTCRRMSIVHRGLMKACLTPSGKQRIIEPLHFLWNARFVPV